MQSSALVLSEVICFCKRKNIILSGPVIKLADAAKIALHILGEDEGRASNDCGGVTLLSLRHKIHKYGDPRTLTVQTQLLPTILHDVCMVTFTQGQVSQLFAEVAQSSVPRRSVSNSQDAVVLATAHANASLAEYGMAKYSGWTVDQLKDELQDRDAELARTRAVVSYEKGAKIAAQRRERYWSNKCDAMTQNLEEQTALVNHLRQCQNYRKHGKRKISLVGGYKLALKRNIAHASGSAVVAMVAGDEEQGSLRSRGTVFKFEHLAALAQRAVAKHGYKVLQEPLACMLYDSLHEYF